LTGDDNSCTVHDVRLNKEALTVIRERTGLSKTELAERAGIDRTLVHRLENGERNCTPTVMRKLATALDCPLFALMGPSDDGEAA
jgi:transcriptional regulator with XRE-family HTH domain